MPRRGTSRRPGADPDSPPRRPVCLRLTDREVGRRTGRQPVRVAERTGYVNARTRLDYAEVGPACGLISGGIAGGWTWTRVGELATSSGASPWRRSTASVRARRTARAPRAAMTAAPAGAAASHGHCGIAGVHHAAHRRHRGSVQSPARVDVQPARPRPGRPRQPDAVLPRPRALPPRPENSQNRPRHAHSGARAGHPTDETRSRRHPPWPRRCLTDQCPTPARPPVPAQPSHLRPRRHRRTSLPLALPPGVSTGAGVSVDRDVSRHRQPRRPPDLVPDRPADLGHRT